MSLTREISIEDFAATRSTDPLIDVRERTEYATGHLSGAVLIPMGQLTSRMKELDRSRPVYVICATGNRSLAMADLLHREGFDAWSVAGGTSAWARSGRPIEGGLG
jgi:rhodanese-related sulfurtransferase